MATESYETLAAKNPYSAENRAAYKMGGIEKFLHDTLGFRTGVDVYNENMDNASKEYLAQLASTQREEEYNDASSQAQRMRDAGLNPDLDPSTVSAGEASEMNEIEGNRPEAPIGEDMKVAMQTGQFITDLGFGLINSLISGFSLKNAFKKTGIEKALAESTIDLNEDRDILDSVYEALGAFPKYDKNGEITDYENGAYIAGIKGLTGKRFAKFSKLYDELYRGLPGYIKRTKTQTEAIEAGWEKEIADQVGQAKQVLAESELKVAEIKNEKAKREQEFLKNHPNFNEAELRAGILQHQEEEAKANAAFAGWRKIQAEADAKMHGLYSNTIKKYEDILGIMQVMPGTPMGIKIGIELHKQRQARKFYGTSRGKSFKIKTGHEEYGYTEY